MIRNETIVIGICFVIVLLIMILNVFMPAKTANKSLFDKSNLIILLVIIFLLFPLSLVKLYAVNCMLEGNCDLFVYILEGIVIFITFIYLILFIMKLMKQKRPIVVPEEKNNY